MAITNGRVGGRTLLRFASVAVPLTAAVGYAIYQSETSTGLPGAMRDLSMRWFGVADCALIDKFCMIVYLGLAFSFTVLIRKTIGRLQRGGQSVPGQQGGLATASSPRGISPWAILIAASILPVVTLGGLSWILDRSQAIDRERPIYALDMSESLQLPPADAKFATLSAFAIDELQCEYTESNSPGAATSHRFTPLVEGDWTADRPATYFLHLTGNTPWLFERQESPLVKIDGTLCCQLTRNELPGFVKTEYQRAGLKVAEPCYVLEVMNVRDGKVDLANQHYGILLVVGIIVGAVILIMGSFFLVNRSQTQAVMC